MIFCHFHKGELPVPDFLFASPVKEALPTGGLLKQIFSVSIWLFDNGGKNENARVAAPESDPFPFKKSESKFFF